jgi:hypothetical protein
MDRRKCLIFTVLREDTFNRSASKEGGVNRYGPKNKNKNVERGAAQETLPPL